MALLDFLKRKKEKEKAKSAKKPQKEAEKDSAAEKEIGKKETTVQKPASKSKTVKGFSYEVVRQPHISEKASALAEKNQYVFKVLKDSNKTDIKKAVQGLYGVDVLSVNIINIPKKKRRLGRTQGFKKGYSKAVVKIKEGQKIEIL